MRHLRSLLSTNVLISIFSALSGILCINSFVGAELTNYLTYIGVLGVAGVGIQSLQTSRFLDLSIDKKIARSVSRSGVYFSVPNIFIILILFWLYRSASNLLPVCLSIFLIIVISQRLHSLMGRYLNEGNVTKYGKLNFIIGSILLALALIQFLLHFDLWIYLIFVVTVYFCILYLEKNTQIEMNSRPILEFSLNKSELSIGLIWGLVTIDLFLSSRILNTYEAKQFYFLTLVTKVISIYYVSVFYSSKINNLKTLKLQSLVLNILILFFYPFINIIWNYFVHSAFPIPFCSYFIGLLYGNFMGIFLNSTKSHFHLKSSKNRNLILSIAWFFLIGLILLINKNDLSARSLSFYLMGYYCLATITLYLVKRIKVVEDV